MTYKQLSNENSTYIYEINLTRQEIADQTNKTEKELITNLETAGFPKGKVPYEIGKKQLNQEKVDQDVLSSLLSQAYSQIIKENNLKPITNPKVELKKAKKGEDWQIIITVAVSPNFSLPDYKKLVTDIKGDLKKSEIWTPDKGKPEQDEKKQQQNKEQILQKIFNDLLTHTSLIIPDLLIENEVNKRLTQLIDDVRASGLTIETYLQSKKQTKDSLQEKIKQEVTETYKLEMILDKIAEVESITVSDAEIENLFKQFDDEKHHLIKDNLYFYTI